MTDFDDNADIDVDEDNMATKSKHISISHTNLGSLLLIVEILAAGGERATKARLVRQYMDEERNASTFPTRIK